jgi:hypothetical protein
MEKDVCFSPGLFLDKPEQAAMIRPDHILVKIKRYQQALLGTQIIRTGNNDIRSPVISSTLSQYFIFSSRIFSMSARISFSLVNISMKNFS